MPTVQVPLRKLSEIKKLKNDDKLRIRLKKLVRLSDESKEIEKELKRLREQIYPALNVALDEDEKSIEFLGHRITAYQGEPRETWDFAKLAELVPAKTLKKCKKMGNPPSPTVSVVRLETQEEKAARQVTDELMRD